MLIGDNNILPLQGMVLIGDNNHEFGVNTDNIPPLENWC